MPEHRFLRRELAHFLLFEQAVNIFRFQYPSFLLQEVDEILEDMLLRGDVGPLAFRGKSPQILPDPLQGADAELAPEDGAAPLPKGRVGFLRQIRATAGACLLLTQEILPESVRQPGQRLLCPAQAQQ